jgi:hypothetical protein
MPLHTLLPRPFTVLALASLAAACAGTQEKEDPPFASQRSLDPGLSRALDRLEASHKRATAYASVPSPGGQYILVNKPPLHLTFELQGKSPLRSVKTGTNNLVFEVDAQIFQLMAVPVSTIRQRLTPTRAGLDEHLLRAHFQGEKQHFRRPMDGAIADVAIRHLDIVPPGQLDELLPGAAE